MISITLTYTDFINLINFFLSTILKRSYVFTQTFKYSETIYLNRFELIVTDFIMGHHGRIEIQKCPMTHGPQPIKQIINTS